MSKMDRQGVRTPAQLEQKYNFSKSFAEVMGIAKDAREAADNAASSLENKLSSEEIFNRLTKNGALQGLLKDENGNIYINAEYLMGKYVYTTDIFFEPEREEVITVQQHIIGNATISADLIPYYDANGDGRIDIVDLAAFQRASLGEISLADRAFAKKTEAKLEIDLTNPEKVIRISGKNMWGRDIEKFVGYRCTNIKNLEIKDYVVESGSNGTWTYEKWASGKSKCWAVISEYVTPNLNWADKFAYGTISAINFPIGLFVDAPVLIPSISDDSGSFFLAKTKTTSYSTGNLYAVTVAASDTTISVQIGLEATGRWK